MEEKHCNCHHEHHHEKIKHVSKYENVLSKYNCDLDDNTVREAVKKIIAEHVPENDTLDVKKFLMGSIELTTLKTTDSDESVLAFTERVNQYDEQYPDLPHLATICVYPCFAKTVSETLEVEGVEVACVSGSFPSSQAAIEVKIAETALAVRDGATEIDIVMPVGKFLSGDYEGVCDDINEMKTGFASMGIDVSKCNLLIYMDPIPNDKDPLDRLPTIYRLVKDASGNDLID